MCVPVDWESGFGNVEVVMVQRTINPAYVFVLVRRSVRRITSRSVGAGEEGRPRRTRMGIKAGSTSAQPAYIY